MKIHKFLPALLATFLISATAGAQDKIVKYYSQYWSQVSDVDSAEYKTVFERQGDIYKVSSYQHKTNNLFKTSFYQTPDFTKPAEGNMIQYYENGQIQDSGYINNQGEVVSRHVYYPSGKIHAIYKGKTGSQKEKVTGYTETGDIIENFIFEREATFPGGLQKWAEFISNSKFKYDKNTPAGTYNVQIRFVVDAKGAVVEVEPLTNFGFGMEQSAVAAIKKSPRWIPATQFNKPVRAYRIQPVTLIVPGQESPKGKKK